MIQSKKDRAARIARILKECNGASIEKLSGELAVSKMTVRRDLEYLQSANIVSLVNGVAIYRGRGQPDSQEDYQLILEKRVSNSEKERIGRAAAELVKPGDTIIIDIGTTMEYLARNIPLNSPITALCLTINVLFEMYRKNVENLIMTGGYYHPNTQLFESAEAVNLIRQTRATKFFMSAAGVSRELGLTCANRYEMGIRQACIDSSLQKILLVDSKKFGQVHPVYFSPLEKIDMIITDSGISVEWLAVMENMGIKVQVV
ncbi:DeoR family transcriptional regulator [Spirochaetia bacterium]|nr:DeoR family transcriptional regulator [Spirochaetia bacterium]